MKIKFLTMQVKMGRITIEQVPAEYREQVAAQLGGGDE
jgi:hypothetical protein